MSTSVLINDLASEETYYFCVTAVSTSNLESGPSNEVQYTVPAASTAPIAVGGSVVLPEDSVSPVTLQADNATVETAKSPLVFTITREPGHGSLSGDGPNLTYQPSRNFFGEDFFEYTVTSGTRTSAPGVMQITVTPVNDPPLVADSSVNLLEDTSVSFALSVSDPEGDALTYSLTQLPTKGVVTGTPPNLVYTPHPNAAGPDYLGFTVSEGLFNSYPGKVYFSITPVNDAPVALAKSFSVNAGASIPILLQGTDIENTTLTFSVTRGPTGGTLSGSGANWTYTSRSDFEGTDSFDFTANDGIATSAPARISITVGSAPNTAPVAIAQSQTLAEDGTLSIALTGSDAESNPLTFTLSRQPANGTLSGTAPNVSYKPAANFHGTDFFEFTVNDGKLTSAAGRVSLTITPVNDAPIAVAKSHSVNAGASVALALQASDVDNDPISFTITRQPSKGTLSGVAPNLSYKANANATGADSIEYTAHDGKVASAPVVVSINIAPVSSGPVGHPISLTLNEDTSELFSLTGTAAAGKSLTYSVVSQPSKGRLMGIAPSLRYIPNNNYHGTDSIQFVVNDGLQTSTPATVSIVVTPVNDVPLATGRTLSVGTSRSVGVTLSGWDIEGDSLTFEVTRIPTGGTLTGSGTQYTYTARSDFGGVDYLEFTANDGTSASNPARIQFNVPTPENTTPTNTAPVAIAQSKSLAKDATLPITLTGTDAESNPLTFTISRHPSKGSLTGSAPNVTYKPVAGFTGADFFEFTVSDGKLTSAPATVSLTVTSGNAAPIAQSKSFSVNAGASVPVVLLATDGDGDPLTFNVTRPPAKGTLTGTAPNLSYTPAPNFSGSDSFEFTAHDGKVSSAPAVISITVNPTGNTPVAKPLAITLNEDTSEIVTLAGTSPTGKSLTYSVSKQPTYGRLMGTAPNIRYIPNNNYNGSDSFQYVVKDGTLTSAPATVSLVVNPVNDAPLAVNRSLSVAEDLKVSVTLSGSDVDQDSLTIAISQAPLNGTLSGTAPNYVYTPKTNYFGTDTFTFTVSDGTAAPATGKVSINIVSINDAPVAPNQTVTVVRNSSKSFKLGAYDAEASPLTYYLRTQPLNGTLSGTMPNLTYTPKSNFTGTDTLTYSVTDGAAGSTIGTVTLSVGTSTQPSAPEPDALLVDLTQEGDEFVMSFSVVAGVNYRIEGNTVSADPSAPWEVLGELNPEVTTVAEVPTPAPTDDASRYFRVTATDANGTITSEPFGFQRVVVENGTRTYSSPFQGTIVGRTQVASVTGNAIQLATADAAPGWAPASEFASHALVVAGTSDWWPIVGNDNGRIVVDSRGADLATALDAGETLEVVRLSTATEIFGTPGSEGSALQPGDFADFVNGNGTVSTLECGTDDTGAPAYFLHHLNTVSGPVQASSVTLLPGQPIQVQKAGAAGTLWFLGRVQTNPLTPYGVGGTETTGFVSE